MFDLPFRFRRLRQNPQLRNLMRETHLCVNDLILPIFVEEEIDQAVAISSMPGIVRYPESEIPDVTKEAWELGIQAILLFGISHHKDAVGKDTWDSEGLMSRMIRSAKKAVPEMLVISDNCFCEYTEHGHCGVINELDVDNDVTLVNLQSQAIIAAKAGVDILAPSAMMDGQIMGIRSALDDSGYSHVPIMSYSTKFASSFYGPFRNAVDSTFKGSRNTYQMDFSNSREAVAESIQDENEGADILMVKPGIAYLDILTKIRSSSLLPLAVYQVSGEYAMIKASALAGVIEEKEIVLEMMIAFKRAGADMIITYYSKDLVKWIK